MAMTLILASSLVLMWIGDCCSTYAVVAGKMYAVDSDQKFRVPSQDVPEARRLGYHVCGRYGCEKESER
jgi:hypothetical protein